MARDELILGQNQSREPGRGGRIFKAGALPPSSLGAAYVSGDKLGPCGGREEREKKGYWLSAPMRSASRGQLCMESPGIPTRKACPAIC